MFEDDTPKRAKPTKKVVSDQIYKEADPASLCYIPPFYIIHKVGFIREYLLNSNVSTNSLNL